MTSVPRAAREELSLLAPPCLGGSHPLFYRRVCVPQCTRPCSGPWGYRDQKRAGTALGSRSGGEREGGRDEPPETQAKSMGTQRRGCHFQSGEAGSLLEELVLKPGAIGEVKGKRGQCVQRPQYEQV